MKLLIYESNVLYNYFNFDVMIKIVLGVSLKFFNIKIVPEFVF